MNGFGSFASRLADVTVARHSTKLHGIVRSMSRGLAFTILIVIVSTHDRAWADPLFAPPQNYRTGLYPSGVAIGDVNGDGKPDLVVTNHGTDDVTVLLGLGDGTFGSSSNYHTLQGPLAVAMGDLVGHDGKPDIAVTASNADAVLVLARADDGTFTPAGVAATGPYPYSIAIADLNEDGFPDLVTANGSYVSINFNNQNDTFGPKVDLPLQAGSTSVAIADLNGDGHQDIVAVDGGVPGAVSVFLGTGGVFFGARSDYETPLVPTTVAIGDLNHDGKLDLVVGTLENGVSVLLGSGDGTFGPHREYPIDPGALSVAIGDLNGDGNPDVAIANYGSGKVSGLLGNGDGTFQPEIIFASNSVGYPFSIALADLNGDGKNDLAVANNGTGDVSVLINIASAPNRSPDCGVAVSVPANLWPPSHDLTPIVINGVTDPDGDPVTITVTAITQDEPIAGARPDAEIVDGQARVRSERAGSGNGRVYRISFRAADGHGGSCDGAVSVCVPHDQGPGSACVDDGPIYDSLRNPGIAVGDAAPGAVERPTTLWMGVGTTRGARAVVQYGLPEDRDVTLVVYDVSGRRIAALVNERQAAGVHQVSWGGLESGVYFYRLRAGAETLVRTGIRFK